MVVFHPEKSFRAALSQESYFCGVSCQSKVLSSEKNTLFLGLSWYVIRVEAILSRLFKLMRFSVVLSR